MILADFEQEAVLERLLRYERRIESSLYRTLNELRRVHDQCCKAGQEVAGTLERWRQEDAEARKTRALACDWPGAGSPGPAGAATNTPGAHDCGLGIPDGGLEDAGLEQQTLAAVQGEDSLRVESCKTNPNSECEVSSLKLPVSDQQEHVPSPVTSNFTLQTSNSPPHVPVGGVTCETNPIGGAGACECGLRIAH
jgi:hypothetical protein